MTRTKHLIIKGRVNINILDKYNIENNDDLIFFFIDYSKYNILLNTMFTKCFVNDEFCSITWELVLITNQGFFRLEEIEEGYKTICGFKIHSKSNTLTKIPFVDNWYNEIDIKLEIE